MSARPWRRVLPATLDAWLELRRTPAPALAGVAPPAPLFGRRRAGTPPQEGAREARDEAATRAVERAHELALAFDELEPRERSPLAASIVEASRRVAREAPPATGPSELFRPALALAWAGRLFVGDEPRRWSAEALRRLAAGLEQGVALDGVVKGGGVREHVAALSDALECRALLASEDEVERHDPRLEQLLQAAADLRTPGRLTVDAPGAPQCLAAWRRLTGRRPQARASFALEDSGLYGVRGGRSLFVIDGGAPCRRGALGLEWTVDGRRILVDEGVEPLEPGPDDVLALDGLARGRQRAPRVERTRLERLEHTLVLEAVHHGYASLRGKPLHRRRVTATAHGLSVEDYVSGGAGQRVRAELVLHPQVEVRRRGESLVLVAGPVTALLETRHDVQVERAWWLGEDGEWRSTRRLMVHYDAAPCSGSLRIDRLAPKTTLTSFLRRESLALDRLGAGLRAGA